MNDRPMSDEHVVELIVSRVMRETRDSRRWFIGIVVALIAALSAVGMLYLEAQTRELVMRDAEGYVQSYARVSAEDAAKVVARTLDTSLPLEIPELETVRIGDTSYDLGADEVKRIQIPVASTRRNYVITATGVADFDPVISLYRTSQESTRPSLLAYNDDFGNSADSRISVMLQGGYAYELRVQEFSGYPGQVTVSVQSN